MKVKKKVEKKLKKTKRYDIVRKKIKDSIRNVIKEEKMKRVISNIIFGLYVIIAIFVTICLLSYNEFKVTEFGDNSLLIIKDDNVGENFNKGDLVIVNSKAPINVGQKAFFYDTSSMNVGISLGEVVGEEKITKTETTYTIEGDYKVSSEYVIGPEQPVTVIKGIGTILGILESKWGFLFLIVLPALIAFLYQIGVVVSEIRKSNEKDIESSNEKR